MRVTLVVPDPPPMRASPGNSADRRSPNAQPLARAGEALVSSDPTAFPLRVAGTTVVFGKTMPEVDPLGYQSWQPILEVLTDVGAVVDGETGWVLDFHDPSADFYVVTLETGSP
jgi:hypothetical protein